MATLVKDHQDPHMKSLLQVLGLGEEDLHALAFWRVGFFCS
jgi:hypothetical protein